MKSLNLRKLLKKLRALGDLEALTGLDVRLSLYDAQGEHLAGPAVLSPEALESLLRTDWDNSSSAQTLDTVRPLIIQGDLAGLVVATQSKGTGVPLPGQMDAIADLLTNLVTQVLENRALAQETLERYREINLLYRVQDSLGAQLELEQIANLILKESIRVIKATSGALLLLSSTGLAFQAVGQHGATLQQPTPAVSDTIAGWVIHNRQPAIVNDVSSDSRCGPADAEAQSLLCVPLTTDNESIGVLTLYDKAEREIFTASDRKLLTALASQAANAIKTARKVATRERRLKAQIQELRIEIDEMRKQRDVRSITGTDYFIQLQQSAQQMRREFEEES